MITTCTINTWVQYVFEDTKLPPGDVGGKLCFILLDFRTMESFIEIIM